MEHNCFDYELELVEEEGVEYKCPICGEIYLLGCATPVIPPYEGPMCNVFIEWIKEVSIPLQIRNAKRLFPDVKKMNNSDLLHMIRANQKLEVGEMSLPEGNEWIKKGKEVNLKINIKISPPVWQQQPEDIIKGMEDNNEIM